MEQLDTLKLFIRNGVRDIKQQQKLELKKQLNEERKLRKTIRTLLREKEDTTQYNSTGLNALDELLGSIVPIVKSGYKKLRTNTDQRESFEAHILRGMQNLLSTASVYFSAEQKLSKNKPAHAEKPSALLAQPDKELKEQEGQEAEQATNKVAVQPAAVGDEQKPEKPNALDAFEAVEGEDETGRNFALETFKKIQKQVLEKYSLLSNEQDREMFYDYLITNMKLYFDKFEDELKITPEAPTTPEYEAEKAKKEAELQGAAPEGAPGEEPTAPEAGAEIPAAETPPEAAPPA